MAHLPGLVEKYVRRRFGWFGLMRNGWIVLMMTLGAVFPALSATTQTVDLTVAEKELATIFRTAAPELDLRYSTSSVAIRLRPLLVRQAGYLISLQKPAVGLPGAVSIAGELHNEHSIRPNARTLNGLAFMARTLPDDAFPTTLTRPMCRDNAIAMLRFVLPTHGAGNIMTASGKQWNSQWQSALWASSAGMGAWLLWDELDPELQWLAARMIADEADRFVGQRPPGQVEDDTKAEENAWNSTVISLAACMFPHHPHHQAWMDTAKTWMVSSFVRKADIESSRTIDGATLAARGLEPTLHDDFTMENHHRVHPDYMNTINMCLEQWTMYSWAGLPRPEALTFNTREVYGTLRALTFPDLGYVYVNGQDWQLHRNPQWLPTHALQAIFSKDPAAAFLMHEGLRVNELMMGRTEEGGVFLPEEFSFPSAQADTLEMYMHVYLAVGSFGEGPASMTASDYWKSLTGVHLYEAGKFAVTRTAGSVSTFSWGDQPMGMILPLQKDLLLAPNERNLIGTIAIHGLKKEQPKVIKAVPRLLDGNFTVSGEISRANGAFSQRFAYTALADGRTVYIDDLTVLREVHEPQINLGTLSVLNDKNWIFHDGSRQLFWENGQRSFRVRDGKPAQPAELSSKWYNLDDTLGIVVAASGERQYYDDNKKIGNGRLEQHFHLNSLLADASQVDANSAPLTRTTVVFYPNQKHAETAISAKHVVAEWPDDGRCLLKLDDGVVIEADLAGQAVTIR